MTPARSAPHRLVVRRGLRPSRALGVFVAFASVAFETHFALFLLGRARLPDVVMLYLLGVVLVAMTFDYVASLLAALLGVLAFDFFFTTPYYSLRIEEPRYIVTCAIMLFVAFVITNLTERVRANAATIAEREERTAKLYAVTRELSSAPDADAVLAVSARHLAEVFASDVRVLLAGADGRLALAHGAPLEPSDTAAVERMLASGATTEAAAEALATSGAWMVPMATGAGQTGALVLRTADATAFADPTRRALLVAFATQIGLAVERARLADKAQRAELDAQNERLRNALLSSVSHDLRTPLAVVKGAATALLEGDDALPGARRREYLETISDEASRLNRLVRNLLDMTSLEAGALRVTKEWQPIEEVVGVALARLEDRLEGRAVDVRIPADLALVPLDEALVEQVLINLIENATKYTPPGTRLDVSARQLGDVVEIEIADEGPGVPPGEEERVFEKFHRASRAAAGMGLGLAICRGIVAAHGGTIACRNRAEGGASFRFTLPCGEGPPSRPRLPELGDEA